MKKIGKSIVIGLAIIGAVCIVQLVNKFIAHEREARIYLKRCERVKIGMTLKEVREVMEDSTWNSMENHGEFRFQYYGQNKYYELDYPAVFAASGRPIIEFDAENMKVISVYCEN